MSTEQALDCSTPRCSPIAPCWWPPASTRPRSPDHSAALPPLLSQLVARHTRRVIDETDTTAASMTSLVARLHGLPAEQRHSHLVDLVCGNAATVLGRTNPADINAGSVFQDLGL